MPNYYPRRIQPADQLVYDASGNLVGVRSGTSGDETIYGLNSTEYQAFQSLVSRDGITGTWRQLPASGVLMRVRMTGTGTVTMDSATGDLGAGTVTTGAYTATVSGTQTDDFAYPGDVARSIRFTLTGTAAVEVY